MPSARRISATSGSESAASGSTSTASFFPWALGASDEGPVGVVPLVLSGGLAVDEVGRGLGGALRVVVRGPLGGGREVVGFKGLRDRGGLEVRGGVRVRVRVVVRSFRGERERRDGGSSADSVSLLLKRGKSTKCTDLAVACVFPDSGSVPCPSCL